MHNYEGKGMALSTLGRESAGRFCLCANEGLKRVGLQRRAHSMNDDGTALSRMVTPEQAAVTVEEAIRSLLSHDSIDSISERRIHHLLFLAELNWSDSAKTEKPLTEATYRKSRTGIHSRDISRALDDLSVRFRYSYKTHGKTRVFDARLCEEPEKSVSVASNSDTDTSIFKQVADAAEEDKTSDIVEWCGNQPEVGLLSFNNVVELY